MDYLSDIKLILGSKSPRRSQLLKEAGINFETRFQDVDENFDPNMPVIEVAQNLATRKGMGLKSSLKDNEIILTADSVVIVDNEIFNKPENFEDGRRILKILSNKLHTVATGVSLIAIDYEESFTVKTEITFDEISDEEINYYLNKFEPYDKAGAYGIQDWIGWCKIKEIKGSYSNVMGLPVREVYNALQKYQILKNSL